MSRAETIKGAAIDAAGFADNLARALLLAGCRDATPDEIRADLERAYSAWSSLSVRMATLEGLAPQSAQAGYERSMMLREMIVESSDRRPAA